MSQIQFPPEAILYLNLTFSSGCFYLLGMWYKRSEAQKRFTFFFASTSLAGAFGGLLASAIGKSELTQPMIRDGLLTIMSLL